MVRELDGTTAIVTGAGSGIGAAILRRLESAGALTVAIDRPGGSGSVRADSQVERRVLAFEADVRDRRGLEAVRDRLLGSGVVPNVLIANAGINIRGPAIELADQDLRAILETNLYGVFVTLQVFAPALLTRPGARFVVTSSVAAIHGFDRRAAYSASKAGVSGLVRSLAVEWGPLGATVNAVGPGIIRTPLTEKYMAANPGAVEAAIANTPLRRLGEAEDVADVVVFLISDAARFMTGQTVFVDGGLTAGSAWW